MRYIVAGLLVSVTLAHNCRGAENWSVQRTVVDPEGQPVPGVKLTCIDYERPEERREAVTDSQGNFTVQFPARTRAAKVQAVDEAHTRRGFTYLYPEKKGRKPKQITVHPLQEITVEVVDADDKPLEGATVDISQSNFTLFRETTGKDGVLKSRVAVKTPVSVRALKGHAGFDYLNYYPSGKREPDAPLPSVVKLKLHRSKTIEIRAIDHLDNPLRGVVFELTMIQRTDRPGLGSFPFDDLVRRTTNRDGVAVYDWIPLDLSSEVRVLCRTEEFETDLLQLFNVHGNQNSFPVRLWRKTKLSGKVKMPDGTPAADTKIRIQGKGPASTTAEYKTSTASDGTFNLEVRAEQVYIIVAEKDNLVGHQTGVVLHEFQPVENVAIQLRPGTVVTGRVTQGKNTKPVPNEHIRLILDGGTVPPDIAVPPSFPQRYAVFSGFSWEIKTDPQGAYRFLVAPGDYLLSDPLTYQPAKLTVQGEPEILRHFHIEWDDSTLLGKIVDPQGKPLAGASLEGFYIFPGMIRHNQIQLKTDAEGKFKSARKTVPIRFRIFSADRKLGLIARVPEEDEKEQTFQLLPLSTIRGRLVTPNGEPQKLTTIHCETNLYEFDPNITTRNYFWKSTFRTDANGRFEFTGLPSGGTWDVRRQAGPKYFDQDLKSVNLMRPGDQDLGDLAIKEP